MYLKRLEIIGFKSFAEKTKLDFEPGITAVVGPNGCGKTNIVDSIKWAIGEQSAKSLRSGKMEDIIFHGTDERKGISMAEVSLTFDNSDKRLPLEFSEVTVTRRVFRSGESHYFLNKNLCRLKDIDDVFMDTGVGMKAYSVFEQGKMDLILSSKPEDRRFVFEEAAGISKYKERKRETLHKLENTENNLIRLNDIVKEVQRQINSIDRQAAKARRYKKIQEEFKAIEIKSLVYQLRELKSKCLEFEKDKIISEEAAARMRESINAKESKHAELRQKLRQFDSEMGLLQEEKLSLDKKLIECKHNIQYKANKINDLNERNKRIENDIAAINEQIKTMRETLEELLKELQSVSDNKANLRNLVEKKHKDAKLLEVECSDLSSRINEKKDLLVGKTAKESGTKNEISSIDFELKTLVLKGKRDFTELNKKKRHQENILQELKKMEEMLGSQKDVVLNIKQAIKDHEEKVFSLKDEVTGINKTLNDTQQFFTEKRSEYEILSNQKMSNAGYPDGVRLILGNKDEYPGVVGLVGDLITVPKEYVDAVSSFLGQKMQWIVVDTTDNAYNAISKLQAKGIPQTVFLVLELLPLTENISNIGIGARAVDIVGYDKDYEKLVSFLLGRVLVVPKIDDIKDAINRTTDKVVLASNDCIVMDKQGIVWGGKLSGETLNVIGRDTNINELKVVLNNLSTEILELTEKCKLRQERLVLEERHFESAKNNLYNEEISLGVQENDFIRCRSSYDSLCEEIKILELGEKEGAGEKDGLEAARINKESELGLIAEEIKAIYKEIAEGTELLKSLQAKKEDEEKEYTHLKISLVGIEEKENLLDFKRTETQRQLGVFINTIDKFSGEKKDNDTSIQNIEGEVSAAEIEIEDVSRKETEIISRIEVIKDSRKGFDEELAGSEESLRKEREQIDAVYSQLNERQLRFSEMNLRINNIIQKLNDNFKMTNEDIDAVSLDGVVIDLLEQEIMTLRDKLDSMGEVSLLAIEEQDELVKRHEFLNSQMQDLVNAKESLLKTIAKLNTTTKKLFWETFCQIRENFSNIFCQLFGGGKADLVLLDETDILESGIEIIARPPGKKLQNVSLLSGGEKALTAIALLFSMFRVKPSPFCIMDEIDAPLDDSNIERFTELLKEFAKTSQFIIVTHNKRTISAAQSLYGITMQESGVSRIVSVKFAPADSKRSLPQPTATNAQVV